MAFESKYIWLEGKIVPFSETTYDSIMFTVLKVI
jgi:hypothetical protein